MSCTLTVSDTRLIVQLDAPAGEVVAWLVGVLVARRDCLFGTAADPVVLTFRQLSSARVESGVAVAPSPSWRIMYSRLADIVTAS